MVGSTLTKSIMLKSIVLVSGTLLLFSCQPKPQNPNPVPLDSLGSNKDIVSKRRFQKEEISKVLREFPSSYKLVLLFARESRKKPSENFSTAKAIESYPSDFEKNLALGIYQADLAFAAAWGNKKEFIHYFDAVNQFSQTLKLPLLMDKDIRDSISKVSGNDTLLNIYQSLFIEQDLKLKTQIEQETAIITVTSSWVESMYLGAKMLDEKTEGYREIIAEQKENLDQLLQLWNSVEVPPSDELLSRLQVLAAIYDKVDISRKRKNGSKAMLRNDSVSAKTLKINMSAPVLQAIENEFSSIRQYIVKQDEFKEING